MSRLVIKRSDAKREFGGLKPWLKERLDLPDDVHIRCKSGGMHGNMKVIFSDAEWSYPEGYPDDATVVETGAYFSSPPSAHYKVDLNNVVRDQLEALR